MRDCTVEGCHRKYLARGWCKLHYDRWRRTGSTELRKPTYGGFHLRLSRNDSASNHRCVDCGQVAHEWSYHGNDPFEEQESSGLRYSLDVSYYSPRCRRCHRQHDLRLRGGGTIPDSVINQIRLGLAAGESQDSIARRLGCSQSYVSLIKLGKVRRKDADARDEVSGL